MNEISKRNAVKAGDKVRVSVCQRHPRLAGHLIYTECGCYVGVSWPSARHPNEVSELGQLFLPWRFRLLLSPKERLRVLRRLPQSAMSKTKQGLRDGRVRFMRYRLRSAASLACLRSPQVSRCRNVPLSN